MFLTSPKSICIISALYLLTIKQLVSFMKNRNAFNVKSQMHLYNTIQVLGNLYMVAGFCYEIYPNGSIMNIKYTANLENLVYLHYLSKYLDYLDTIFMILKKNTRQLSFLHVYHHATIPCLWGGLLYIGHGNGSASLYCLTNSAIHVMMYSHYLITSYGYANPFKYLITRAQIAQFILFIAYSIAVMNWENIYPRYLAWVGFFYNIPILILFGNFYHKTFMQHKEIES